MIGLFKWLDAPWERARDYLRLDLEAIELAINRWKGQTFNPDNTLKTDALGAGAPDEFPAYLGQDNAEDGVEWVKVDVAAGVKNRLPLSHFRQATAANVLLGRGAGSGAGEFQEISLGAGLTMTKTTLSAGASGSGTDHVVLSDGGNPPLAVDDGDGNFIYVVYTP